MINLVNVVRYLVSMNAIFARLGIPADADTLAGITSLVSEQVGDSRHLDFKRQIHNADDLADDLCALANTRGGVLIIGVGTDSADPRRHPAPAAAEGHRAAAEASLPADDPRPHARFADDARALGNRFSWSGRHLKAALANLTKRSAISLVDLPEEPSALTLVSHAVLAHHRSSPK